jgi:hypothetical protein
VERCEMGQRSRLPWIGMIDPQITKSIFADSGCMNQSAPICEICRWIAFLNSRELCFEMGAVPFSLSTFSVGRFSSAELVS